MQVLEMGIIVHSVVIGLGMGASQSVCTIRPLVAAMCFHQLFEGMGLGGCILQAEYGLKMRAGLVFFFSTTTPFGRGWRSPRCTGRTAPRRWSWSAC